MRRRDARQSSGLFEDAAMGILRVVIMDIAPQPTIASFWISMKSIPARKCNMNRRILISFPPLPLASEWPLMLGLVANPTPAISNAIIFIAILNLLASL
jgi:hypothetical protein